MLKNKVEKEWKVHNIIFSIPGVLWFGACVKWVGLLTHWKINLFETINSCLSYFIFYFSVYYTSALLCIMSLEKFAALYFPLRSRRICTVKTAQWVSGITALTYSGLEILFLIFKKEGQT